MSLKKIIIIVFGCALGPQNKSHEHIFFIEKVVLQFYSVGKFFLQMFLLS